MRHYLVAVSALGRLVAAASGSSSPLVSPSPAAAEVIEVRPSAKAVVLVHVDSKAQARGTSRGGSCSSLNQEDTEVFYGRRRLQQPPLVSSCLKLSHTSTRDCSIAASVRWKAAALCAKAATFSYSTLACCEECNLMGELRIRRFPLAAGVRPPQQAGRGPRGGRGGRRGGAAGLGRRRGAHRGPPRPPAAGGLDISKPVYQKAAIHATSYGAMLSRSFISWVQSHQGSACSFAPFSPHAVRTM